MQSKFQIAHVPGGTLVRTWPRTATSSASGISAGSLLFYDWGAYERIGRSLNIRVAMRLVQLRGAWSRSAVQVPQPRQWVPSSRVFGVRARVQVVGVAGWLR
jgi:hypothetical protein